MTGDDIARIAYLVILGSAIAGWLVVESRGRMGQAARQALAWALIFVGLAAGYGLWQDMGFSGQRQTIAAEGRQVVLDRAPDGHFYLTLKVGAVPVRFMIDTGATNVVLSDRDVERLGIDKRGLAFLGEARTANGTIRTARVALSDVTLEGHPEGTVPAWVGDGRLDVSLLGMDYLNRFQRIEISGGRLVLSR